MWSNEALTLLQLIMLWHYHGHWSCIAKRICMRSKSYASHTIMLRCQMLSSLLLFFVHANVYLFALRTIQGNMLRCLSFWAPLYCLAMARYCLPLVRVRGGQGLSAPERTDKSQLDNKCSQKLPCVFTVYVDNVTAIVWSVSVIAS